MKFKGKVIPAPEPVVLRFYRGGEVIELRIQAILSFDEFEAMVPLPKAPYEENLKTGAKGHDYDDKVYLKKIEQYSEMKTNYTIVKGLSATTELEWETVKLNEPDTWKNWRDEMQKHFTEIEMNEIVQGMREANSPSQRRMREAFDSFTPSQVDEPKLQLSSQEEELPVTESGGPANVSG